MTEEERRGRPKLPTPRGLSRALDGGQIRLTSAPPHQVRRPARHAAPAGPARHGLPLVRHLAWHHATPPTAGGVGAAMEYLLVGVGGFLGANARYVLGALIA